MLKVAVFVLMFAVPAGAQTVLGAFDLAALDWGRLDMPTAIETDGDESSIEALVRSRDTGLYRVVTQRRAGMCAGEWFSPFTPTIATTPPPLALPTVSVQRVGKTDQLWVREVNSDTVTVIGLNTPVCLP